MPRSRATIQFAIWRDKDFRILAPTAQLTYFMLVSQRDVTQAGTMPLVPHRWIKGSEHLEREHLEVALGQLEEARFVYVDDDTEELLIRSLIRNDGIAEQPYVLISAARDALATESDTLRRVLACELRRVRKGIPTDASKGRAQARAFLDETIPELENGNPSRTLPEPSQVYPRTLREPFANPSNPSRTLGGGGGGGGVFNSPHSSTTTSSLSPDRHAGPDQPERATGRAVPADGWRIVRDTIPDTHPQAVRSDLAIRAGALLHGGTPEADVRDALDLWLTKPHAGPGLLPSLVSEVVKNRTTTTTGRPSTTDARVAAAQALKAELGIDTIRLPELEA